MRAWGWIIGLSMVACDVDGLHPAPEPSPSPALPAVLRYANGACQGAELTSVDHPVGPEERAVHVFSNGMPLLPGPVSVVLDLGRSVTLVLNSGASVAWHVELLPGTTVDEVLLVSPAPSSVDLPDAHVVQRESSHACGYVYGSARCDVVALLDLIQEQYGAEPTSIHGCYGGTAFGLYDVLAPVRWEGVAADPALRLSADRLTATASAPAAGAGGLRPIFATHPRSRGRSYFEVEVLEAQGSIGVSNPLVSDACLWSRDGGVGCPGAPRLEGYGPGDVLGVAVDLDKLQLYYSKNGRWITGNPATGNGLALPSWSRRSGLFPTATLAEGDSLRARFASAELRYSAPEGFTEWRRINSID